jgi:hypothetical protein
MLYVISGRGFCWCGGRFHPTPAAAFLPAFRIAFALWQASTVSVAWLARPRPPAGFPTHASGPSPATVQARPPVKIVSVRAVAKFESQRQQRVGLNIVLFVVGVVLDLGLANRPSVSRQIVQPIHSLEAHKTIAVVGWVDGQDD